MWQHKLAVYTTAQGNLLATEQAAARPRRFKETTNSKWDDYYEAESPPSYPQLQRISSARQGSYSDKALLLLSGTPQHAALCWHMYHIDVRFMPWLVLSIQTAYSVFKTFTT